MSKEINDNPIMETYNSYRSCARSYFGKDIQYNKRTDIDYYANRYCDALDNGRVDEASACFSVIVCTYWFVVKHYMETCSGGNFEAEEYVDWLIEAILLAFQYRAWKDPEKHTNARACINVCTETIRKRYYHSSNFMKNKLKREAELSMVSITDPAFKNDAYNDGSNILSIVDTTQDPDSLKGYAEVSEEDKIMSFVQTLINKKKLMQAFIVDKIAISPDAPFKVSMDKVKGDNGETKYLATRHSKFSPSLMYNSIETNPEKVSEEFCSRYQVNKEEVDLVINRMVTTSRQRKDQFVNKTLKMVQKMYTFD